MFANLLLKIIALSILTHLVLLFLIARNAALQSYVTAPTLSTRLPSPRSCIHLHHLHHVALMSWSPGDQVLKHLLSSSFISCNNGSSCVICQSFQLGKHIRLPFSISKSTVSGLFDIVHSDLWTSPITSCGGLRYYILFLDYYSHYLWVYPLKNKS